MRLLVEALEFALPFAEAIAIDKDRVRACSVLLDAAKCAGKQPTKLLDLLP